MLNFNIHAYWLGAGGPKIIIIMLREVVTCETAAITDYTGHHQTILSVRKINTHLKACTPGKEKAGMVHYISGVCR